LLITGSRADGRLALVVLSLEPTVFDGGGLEKIVSEVRQTMAEDLRGTGLTAELTGAPIMQLEIQHALKRDRIDGGGRIVELALPRSGLSSCRSAPRARGRAAFSRSFFLLGSIRVS
jgi:hypothetical protein